MKQYNGEKAIISLTTWRARIDTVGLTLFSLIKQCPGFHIVLVLSEEEFPQKEAELPDSVMAFVDQDLIEILWVYKNYRSFKKVLFTMDKYRYVPVISADDDCIYKYNYAEQFYRAWLKSQKSFISIYVSELENTPHCGGAATLYPPYVFGELGISILEKTKLYTKTNQDDDYYTALRQRLGLRKAKQIGVWKNLYTFHDETCPSHNEIQNISRKDRLKMMKAIMLKTLRAIC